MKKSIAIFSDSKFKNNRPSKVGKTIRENIQKVLKGYVNITNYYLDQLTNKDKINEDLVILMTKSRVIKVKNNVINPNNIIIAKRTFLKKGFDPIKKLKKNTNVLVVNDNFETVFESVSCLYNIGINHINLIPFEKGKSYKNINYAITPAEPEWVPEHIENVFDVDNRVLDISTLLLIIDRLNLNEKIIQKRLYKYYQKIFVTNNAIYKNHRILLKRTEELDNLLNLSNDGILLTTINGKIIKSNEKFKSIFNIINKTETSYLDQLIDNINFKKYYNSKYFNELINYKDKYINLEKKEIKYLNDQKRLYFTFQEVTYIKKLEQNLSQKLRKKGHIAKYTFNDLVGKSSKMKSIIKKSKKISKTDLSILITGESGTGKEVLAQAIHNASNRKNQPFIAINGAAIPESLMESELFGYSSGSFTGASKKGKKGVFEKAHNGTIFLDEIGDMPKHLQSKLLRVLQEQQITPIGSDNIIDINVRVIAATHKNPIKLIKENKFRKDLFYRLNVFPIYLPPLRKRIKDIEKLFHYFTNDKYKLSNKCLEFFQSYKWPGNIRELSNIANYVSTLHDKKLIKKETLPEYIFNHSNNKIKDNNNKEFLDVKNTIEEIIDTNIAHIVLKKIYSLNQIEKTAGRKHLLKSLNKQDLDISSYLLRKIFKVFKHLELIIIKKGRRGNYITEKGIDIIKSNILIKK